MEIPVHWQPIASLTDEMWQRNGCLYAYLAPRGHRILYVGMAWRATVRQRWVRRGKPHYWDDVERKLGLKGHRMIVGELSLYPDQRLTKQLLEDVESLLIHRLQPWGNIRSQESRISRPGMVVRCRGRWPYRRRSFRDGV